MRPIIKAITILLCVVMFASDLIWKDKTINQIYAEENVELAEKIEFETLETQILNSERWCNAPGNETVVSLDVNNKWFLPDEDIVVSYIASNEEAITSFDSNATGFEVVGIEIDDENKNILTTELNCLPDAEEYVLNIPITVGEKETSVSLYAINNEYGTFVSQFSTANAYERYLEYAVTEGLVTLEQAEEMWYAFLESGEDITSYENTITNGNIETNSSVVPASVGTGIVCGILQWKEKDGDIHPLRGIKVELYYDDWLGIPHKLATTYTDDDGNYDAEIDAHDGVYIIMYAGDDNVKVGSGVLGFPYRIKYATTRDVSAGETVIMTTHTIDMTSSDGLTGEDEKRYLETKQAFQISQAAIAARDYADVMMEQEVTPVTVVYPSLPDIGTCYIPVLSCIAIDGISTEQNGLYSYEAWDVIMHEYGHHIEFLLNIMLDPLVSGHTTTENLSDRYQNFDEGTRMAWGESWNTVFGLMAQDYLITQGRLDNNIETVGDTKFSNYGGKGFDLESDATTYVTDYDEWKAARLGDSCEESVMAVLWDLYDPIADEKMYSGSSLVNSHVDYISLSHQEYWDLTTEAWTYRFSARANRFYELYADEPTKIKAFAEILTFYEIAPSCPTVSNIGSVSITAPPEVSWSAQGGSNTYGNNNFDVVIYDTSYSEIIRVENIEETYYTFDASVWLQALKEHGYSCDEQFDIYITIAGYRREPLALDPNFETGPYYSKYERVTVTSAHTPIYSKVDSNYHNKLCSNCGDIETTEIHEYQYSDLTEYKHTKVCIKCGYSIPISHTWGYRNINDRKHEQYCIDCGYSAGVSLHTLKSTDIGRYKQCTGCGIWVDTGLNDIFPIQGTIPKDPEEETE